MAKRLPISLTTIVVIIALSTYFYFKHFIDTPLSTQQGSVIYILNKGTSVKTMVKQMHDQKILTAHQEFLFRVLIKMQGAQKSLKAGEYHFNYTITPKALLEKMIKGDVVQYALTFKEGLNFNDMMESISTHPAVKHTLYNKSTSEVMAILGEPFMAPEGLFFPDTYYFSAGFTDVELLQRARKTMNERLMQLFKERAADCVLKTPYEVLIMASIIEKEAANDEERPLISGVFGRRIQKDMLLQADPTVVYGLGASLNGSLKTKDLRFDTPYNSYIHKGLPPTPIAMPGAKSIYAALHPASGDALFFVAKGDGTHQFSATLEEHNAAVTKYQLKDKP